MQGRLFQQKLVHVFFGIRRRPFDTTYSPNSPMNLEVDFGFSSWWLARYTLDQLRSVFVKAVADMILGCCSVKELKLSVYIVNNRVSPI